MPTFLTLPTQATKKRSLPSPRDELDDYLSSDLDASFASSVSLNDNVTTPEDSEYPQPMDISPAPAKPLFAPKARPRSHTTSARIFGNDVSNTPPPASTRSGASQSGSKRIQRSALPMEWLSSQPPKDTNPAPSSDDAMDVDTSYELQAPGPMASSFEFPSVPHTAAPTITGFNNLFFTPESPVTTTRRSLESSGGPPQHKKRRSHSPETTSFSSSPPPVSSPSEQKFERMFNASYSKPSLQGLGEPPTQHGVKRQRRPVLSAMIQPTDVVASAHSAYPILSTQGDPNHRSGLPPTRRAFSALIAPSPLTAQLSDDSSFDGPDYSSPAQAYAKRQQLKTIRRCDGTEDFRPLTGATAMVAKESPPNKFGSKGLPGFGDNEAHGKILPCHRVTEDGLMRITPQTLDDLLDGVFDDAIRDYHIIDCRFDYEYEGGHIQGAVNINTATEIETMLLGPSLTKPKASISGDLTKKTVLVFHCEFSVKRAPTFAKHLRSKDRAMNNHNYPKIHYPEVYILEGGYCNYFQSSSVRRCEPLAYVRMDDPSHLASRREDLDQFRKTKFGRHKSYTYGDGFNKASTSSQMKRNTAPSGGSVSIFAAASAARGRRGGGGSLSTLAEDGNTTGDAEDTDLDIGDSPCPPPSKSAGVTRGKKLSGRPIVRAETYGPARIPQ